jgi:hypothetical protein
MWNACEISPGFGINRWDEVPYLQVRYPRKESMREIDLRCGGIEEIPQIAMEVLQRHLLQQGDEVVRSLSGSTEPQIFDAAASG